uniref:Uncharacterized protein n=1 Tax=Rhizophora mucronata TaxID=61149 RepID=A0A2P2QH48_RHIMU
MMKIPTTIMSSLLSVETVKVSIVPFGMFLFV